MDIDKRILFGGAVVVVTVIVIVIVAVSSKSSSSSAMEPTFAPTMMPTTKAPLPTIPAPTTLPPYYKNFSYRGCFKDTADRAIPTYIGAKTRQECIDAAIAANANTMGLQYGNQCFIGNNADYSKFGPQTDQASCNLDNPGAWTNVVYKLN
jgi:hypothetical protein